MINKKSAGVIKVAKWNCLLSVISMHAYIIVQTLIFVGNPK